MDIQKKLEETTMELEHQLIESNLHHRTNITKLIFYSVLYEEAKMPMVDFYENIKLSYSKAMDYALFNETDGVKLSPETIMLITNIPRYN